MKSGGKLGMMMARDIKKNWLQYLSMIIITMLAVTLFCGFVSNTLTLEKSVNGYYEKSCLADLIAQFSVIGDADKQYFDDIKASGAASETEYRFYAEGSVNRISGKIFAGDTSVSRPLITGGGAGVLVDEETRQIDSFAIGKEIEIEIELPGFPAALAFAAKITGYMNFAEVSDTYTFCPVYLSIETLETAIRDAGIPFFSAETAYNQVLIKTADVQKTKDAINTHYSLQGDISPLMFIYDRATIESVAALNGEVTTSLRMIYVFPVIFLLVSILVIMTTLSALILRERTNIGTLKGIGISNRRIMMHYSFFGAVLCLIGGLIGAVLGPLIVPNIMLIKYTLVYSMPPISGIVFSILWSAVAVFGVCLLAASIGMLVCRSVIREKPAECMRPQQPKENPLLNLTAGKSNARRSRNLPFTMAARNIIIKPTRALMTIAGVMGCVALLVCSFGIGDTINNSVDLELGGQFKYDISTSYTAAQEDVFLEFMTGLYEDGTVSGYETYLTYYMTARTDSAVKNIKAFEIADGSEFTTISPGSGALLSKSIAGEMKVSTGDLLTLTSGANIYRVTVTGIIETALTKGIFVTSDIFSDSYCSPGMWIAAEQSDGLIELIKEKNGTGYATGMNEMRESVTRSVSSIDTIKYTMMIFAIALSVVVLYNLSLLNLKERNRSIATLKVLGFSNMEISASLVLEIMMLVLVGTGLGLLLGFPVLYLVMSINKIELVAFIYGIKAVSYVYATLISLLTAAGINLIFGQRLKKIKMIDSLKSVE